MPAVSRLARVSPPVTRRPAWRDGQAGNRMADFSPGIEPNWWAGPLLRRQPGYRVDHARGEASAGCRAAFDGRSVKGAVRNLHQRAGRETAVLAVEAEALDDRAFGAQSQHAAPVAGPAFGRRRPEISVRSLDRLGQPELLEQGLRDLGNVLERTSSGDVVQLNCGGADHVRESVQQPVGRLGDPRKPIGPAAQQVQFREMAGGRYLEDRPFTQVAGGRAIEIAIRSHDDANRLGSVATIAGEGMQHGVNPRGGQLEDHAATQVLTSIARPDAAIA